MGKRNAHNSDKFGNFENNTKDLLLFSVEHIQTMRKTALQKDLADLENELEVKLQQKEIEVNKLVHTMGAIRIWTNKKNKLINNKIYFLLCVAEPHNHPERTAEDIQKYQELIPAYDKSILTCANNLLQFTQLQPIIDQRITHLRNEITDLINHMININNQITSINQFQQRRSSINKQSADTNYSEMLSQIDDQLQNLQLNGETAENNPVIDEQLSSQFHNLSFKGRYK